MTSPVDVCNLALDQLRSGVTIQSINPSDGTLAGDVMSRTYQGRVDAVSRAAQWNCLRFESALTMLRARQGTVFNPTGATSSDPPAGWLYEYAWPAQPLCLRMRYIFPFIGQQSLNAGAFGSAFGSTFSGGGSSNSIMLPSTPLTTGNIASYPNGYGRGVLSAPFAVSTDLDADGNTIKVVLSNAPYAQGVYTARITDPDNWDPQFLDAVVMTLAAWTAEPIAGSTALAKEKGQMAAALVMSARISDGNEGTQTSDYTPDWIRVRGGRAMGLTSPGVTAWDTLSLPNGAV